MANEAPIDAKSGNSGETPLCQAAEDGRLDVVESLLAHGANINLINVFNFTPLFEAVGHHHIDVVKVLLD